MKHKEEEEDDTGTTIGIAICVTLFFITIGVLIGYYIGAHEAKLEIAKTLCTGNKYDFCEAKTATYYTIKGL